MDIGVKGEGESSTSGTRGKETTKGSKRGRQESQLELDQAAIEKIISDVLGSESGLASIFGGEQSAGIFDSSVAAQASGDLAANLVGELAKITGKQVTTGEELFDEHKRFKERTTDHRIKAKGSFGL